MSIFDDPDLPADPAKRAQYMLDILTGARKPKAKKKDDGKKDALDVDTPRDTGNRDKDADSDGPKKQPRNEKGQFQSHDYVGPGDSTKGTGTTVDGESYPTEGPHSWGELKDGWNELGNQPNGGSFAGALTKGAVNMAVGAVPVVGLANTISGLLGGPTIGGFVRGIVDPEKLNQLPATAPLPPARPTEVAQPPIGNVKSVALGAPPATVAAPAASAPPSSRTPAPAAAPTPAVTPAPAAPSPAPAAPASVQPIAADWAGAAVATPAPQAPAAAPAPAASFNDALEGLTAGPVTQNQLSTPLGGVPAGMSTVGLNGQAIQNAPLGITPTSMAPAGFMAGLPQDEAPPETRSVSLSPAAPAASPLQAAQDVMSQLGVSAAVPAQDPMAPEGYAQPASAMPDWAGNITGATPQDAVAAAIAGDPNAMTPSFSAEQAVAMGQQQDPMGVEGYAAPTASPPASDPMGVDSYTGPTASLSGVGPVQSDGLTFGAAPSMSMAPDFNSALDKTNITLDRTEVDSMGRMARAETEQQARDLAAKTGMSLNDAIAHVSQPIADTITNRAAYGGWYTDDQPANVTAAMEKPSQFSPLNDLESVRDLPAAGAWGKAVEAYLSDRALGQPAAWGNVDHYRNVDYSSTKSNAWAKNMDVLGTVGLPGQEHTMYSNPRTPTPAYDVNLAYETPTLKENFERPRDVAFASMSGFGLPAGYQPEAMPAEVDRSIPSVASMDMQGFTPSTDKTNVDWSGPALDSALSIDTATHTPDFSDFGAQLGGLTADGLSLSGVDHDPFGGGWDTSQTGWSGPDPTSSSTETASADPGTTGSTSGTEGSDPSGGEGLGGEGQGGSNSDGGYSGNGGENSPGEGARGGAEADSDHDSDSGDGR